MNEDKIKEFKDDFALLIEAGFVAVKQLDEISATRIFQAAQSLNPYSTAPQIGIGYIALNKLEIKSATQTFEKVIDIEPDNHLAKTFLAMCFLLTKGKQKKGQKILHEVIEITTDPTIKNLGVVSLEWYEKDLVKQNKSPFFANQKDPSPNASNIEEASEKHENK